MIEELDGNSLSDYFYSLKSGDVFEIKARPNSSKSEVIWDKDLEKIVVYVHSVPDNNKANLEILKVLRKEFKLRCEIVSGDKSREKKLRVL